MPAGLVEHHRDMLIATNRLGELVEEDLHVVGVGVGQHEREAIIATGLYGAVEIGEGVALVGATRRALAACIPAMADTALLADARLILEDEPQPLARMCIGNRLQPVREPP